MTGQTWTVFCKLPEDGPDQFSEEIDVVAETAAGALRKAQVEIDRDYDPQLFPVKAALMVGVRLWSL